MSISVDLSPSRTTGIAPLHVFFDASGTTSTVSTVRPFHDLHFTWGFGDVGSGTWAYSGKSKNVAYGGVASHVFETAGTYTVALVVKDTDGTENTTTTQVVVYDADTQFPGASTYCFSTSGNFASAPAGSTQVTTSSWATVSGYIAAGRRILLRRGETWSCSSPLYINNTGPGIIGAFGSGAKPVINMTANSVAIQLSSSNPNCGDWRIMDLSIQCNDYATSQGINFNGTANNITALRVDIENCYTGFEGGLSILNWWNANGSPGHTLHDGTCVQECTVNDVIGGNQAGGCACFLVGSRFSFQGNQCDDASQAQHILRTPFLQKGVISNNSLSHCASGRHLVKLHSSYDTVGLGLGQFTEKIVVSDNLFTSVEEAWATCFGPENPNQDERVRDIIHERNHHIYGAASLYAVVVWAAEVTIRNNIMDLSGSNSAGMVFVGRRGVEPASSYVRAYNNSGWGDGAGMHLILWIESTVSYVTLRNNLLYAPNASSRYVYFESGGTSTGFVQSNNQINTNPAFEVQPPVDAEDYDLQPGSPAIDAGYLIPTVYTDFFDGVRVPALDVGAVEHGSSGGGVPVGGEDSIVFGVTI